jgi:signal transduction histidine kinase
VRGSGVSIRWKMTLMYTGLLATLLVAFSLFLYGAVEQLTQEEVIRLPVAGLLPEAANTDISSAHFLLRSALLVDTHQHIVGLLEGAQSLLIVDEVQDQLIDVLLVGMAIAVVLALLIGLWLAGRLLRPIARITDLAQHIGASQDLSRRITLVKRHDEVGRLTVTVNSMLERLEEAFLAQQHFVADASHELKTPLTAILGHAHVIRRHGSRHPELATEALQQIIEQAERMQQMVQDLLLLAESSQNKEMMQEMVSMRLLAHTVITELAPLAFEKTIQVTITNNREEEAWVLGERHLLKQVVANLVENALKFTPAGGQVSVSTWQERSEAEQEVVLEVRDSGCGIASSEVPHIFDRWYRVDKARTRATGGSGLGLSIVQAVVERHGGTVSVESQLGQGSIFQVRLPAAVESEEAFLNEPKC